MFHNELLESGEAQFVVFDGAHVESTLPWPNSTYQHNFTKRGFGKRCTETHLYVVYLPHGYNRHK